MMYEHVTVYAEAQVPYMHNHTHTHTFNGPFSGTTRVVNLPTVTNRAVLKKLTAHKFYSIMHITLSVTPLTNLLINTVTVLSL